ncbi:MAG TPA: ion channel [Candidatus Binataceae bacterium]|jgi:inward rectifier potassium channel|nr:ion channel [Candidatus Binataceae bacterium]
MAKRLRYGTLYDRHGARVSGTPVGSSSALLGDLYHRLLTCSWPALLLLIVALFALTNGAFALGYLLDGGVAHMRPGSFADAFFFSVQTMATIGYGTMAPVSTFANAVVCLEALGGLLGLAIVTGLVFARFSRPTARVRFSRNLVVSRSDGTPSLMFRMANERANRIVEAQVHVVLARQEMTAEGGSMRRFHDLALARGRNALFSLSWTVIHPITEQSPLFGETVESLAAARAQIVASLTGLDESFLQTVHARYIWDAEEIVWNARFVDILNQTSEGVTIDYSRFDDVVPAGDASAAVAQSADGAAAAATARPGKKAEPTHEGV